MTGDDADRSDAPVDPDKAADADEPAADEATRDDEADDDIADESDTDEAVEDGAPEDGAGGDEAGDAPDGDEADAPDSDDAADDLDVVYKGRYELQQLIGIGGMAEVFLARDQLLDRPVAVKRLFAEFAADPSFVERFRREAQAAAKLNHPNIVAVYDWGEEDGSYYIVQEFVDGQSLAQLLRSDDALHPDRAADIAADIAAGLGAAHREGMVHRDLKPGNVLISSKGLVKIADFGIARAFAGGDDELTQAGVVMGTATYFSPEQAQGKPVDPRSDLYALGVLLFELLLGRPPFEADEPVGIAYKHVHEAPPRPRELDDSVPPELEAITLKLLSKNPENRYPSATDVRADLRRFREGERIPAAAATAATAGAAAAGGSPAPRPQSRFDEIGDAPRRNGIFLFFLIIMLLAVAAGMFLWAQALNDEPEQVATTVAVPAVIDQPRDIAVSRLEGQGFVVVEEVENNEGIEAGVVFEQNPGAGEQAEEGANVVVRVSDGPEPLPLRSLIDLTESEARWTLNFAQLGARVERREAPDVPVGIVIDQGPAPGTEVLPGREILLIVSAGGDEVAVPGVKGRTPDAAGFFIGQRGCTITERIVEQTTEVPDGRVVRTDPPAGTALDPDACAVTMFVAQAPPGSAGPGGGQGGGQGGGGQGGGQGG